MKKKWIIRCICLISLTLIMFSCDSDAPYYGDGYASDLNLLYSNKTFTQPDAGNLILSYSGNPLYGKEAYFEMSDATHARIKLFGVLPGDQVALVESVALTSVKDGYTFNTLGTSEKGTTFTLSGSVQKGELTLNLTDVKIPANPLSGTFVTEPLSGTTEVDDDFNVHMYYTMNLLMNWRVVGDEGNDESLFLIQDTDITQLVMGMLSNLIYLVLPDVTFHKDGNITAHYAGIPEDFEVMNLLFGVSEENRGSINTSPINLCTYYVEGNSVFIRPDLEMIMRQIAINNTKAEGEMITGAGDILNLIITLYPTLTNWLTEGIRFNLVENDETYPHPEDYSSTTFYHYRGKYQLYLDEKELAPVLELLPVVLPVLGLDVSSVPIVGSMFDEIIERVLGTSSLKLGLYLGFE